MSVDESIAEVESKVLTVLKKIDGNISHQDIDVVHRLGISKKNKTPNIIVRFISSKTRNNIYKERKKLKNTDAGKPTTQCVFINENLTKKINSCFTWLMTKEKDLVGNTSGPTMEEFTLDKIMTVKPLLSDMKKTLNRSKSQQPILETLRIIWMC